MGLRGVYIALGGALGFTLCLGTAAVMLGFASAGQRSAFSCFACSCIIFHVFFVFVVLTFTVNTCNTIKCDITLNTSIVYLLRSLSPDQLSKRRTILETAAEPVHETGQERVGFFGNGSRTLLSTERSRKRSMKLVMKRSRKQSTKLSSKRSRLPKLSTKRYLKLSEAVH